jgi:hypothetical protein
MKDWLKSQVEAGKELAADRKAEERALVESGLIFDRKEQLELIQPHLMPSETLRAVFGTSARYVGITDKRIIRYEQEGIMTTRKAIKSIPLSKITGVEYEEVPAVIGSHHNLTIHVGSQSYVDSLGDKARAAYELIVGSIL